MDKTALSYAYELLAERNSNGFVEIKGAALEHGNYYEDEARRVYEVNQGVIVTEVGFVPYGENIGGSPDGLVGEDGLIEIKCPHSPRRHQETLSTRKIPNEYLPQLHGNMLVTGRKWCDYVSFQPNFIEGKEISIIRLERDEEYLANLNSLLEEFQTLLIQLDK